MGNAKVTKDPRPKRPRVDKGAEFEQQLRPIFKTKVDDWCKDAANKLPEQPDKDTKGIVVDNLVADFTCAFESMFEAAVHSYLATVTDDDDDDDDEDEDESDTGDAIDADED